MDKLAQKRFNAARRTNRVRAKVTGTSQQPRLSIKVSNLHVSAQIIDDATGKTISAITTVGRKVEGSMTEKASWIGTEIAKKAAKAKVKKVVLDRRGKKYHGRIKALAEAARTAGLEF